MHCTYISNYVFYIIVDNVNIIKIKLLYVTHSFVEITMHDLILSKPMNMKNQNLIKIYILC